MRVPCAEGGDALRFDIVSPCMNDFQDVGRGCKNSAGVISHEKQWVQKLDRVLASYLGISAYFS